MKNIYIATQIVRFLIRSTVCCVEQCRMLGRMCIEISDWFDDLQSSREFRWHSAAPLTIVKNLLGG